jgi:hypothetical protein
MGKFKGSEGNYEFSFEDLLHLEIEIVINQTSPNQILYNETFNKHKCRLHRARHRHHSLTPQYPSNHHFSFQLRYPASESSLVGGQIGGIIKVRQHCQSS